MITKNKNFSGEISPHIIDTIYENCNFSQPIPREFQNKKRGIQIFPNNNIVRTFINCNFTNTEPPPNSILIGGVYVIAEYNKIDRTDTVIINNRTLSITIQNNIIYGRYDPNNRQYVDQVPPIIVKRNKIR